MPIYAYLVCVCVCVCVETEMNMCICFTFVCRCSKQQQYDMSFKYETDGHFDHCGPAVTSTIAEGIEDPTLTAAIVSAYDLKRGECYSRKRRYLAKFTPSFQDCTTACRRATECDVFTWHNSSQVSSPPCTCMQREPERWPRF